MKTETLNRLKVVLAEKQKSQKWLAEELGKSVITVSQWVNNKMQPSVDHLFEIATKMIPNNTKI